MKLRRQRVIAVPLLVGLIAVTACGGGGVSASPSSQAASSQPASTGSQPAPGGTGQATTCTNIGKVNLGWHSVSQSVWPMWIAKDQGFFEKYGIDATLTFAEGNRIESGVISHSTPIAFSSAVDLLDPIAQGADLLAIFSFENGTPTDMIVGASDVKSPADLKGGVVGANELGGETDQEMRYALKQMNLKPDVDVRVVAVGGESTRIAALASGQVKATIVDHGLINKMKDQGFNILYDFTTGDLHVAKSEVITTKSYAKDNGATVQCAVNALVDAFDFWKDPANREKVIDTAVHYSAGVARKDLEDVYDLYASKLPDKTLVDLKAFEGDKALRVEVGSDPALEKANLADHVDNSYVQNALSR